MDDCILKQILADPETYLLKAEMLLRDAEKQLQAAANHYVKTSIQYCDRECRLEQARAIFRAVTAVNTGRKVLFSDEISLKRWAQG